MNFTHLHVHTEYSLLDGSAKIKELVARAKELGMTSLAITDHGVMYGVIDFYKACKAAGIKPIIGCEVYVAPNSRFDREVVKGENRYYHLVLLAKNNLGYHNLSKIVSRGFIDGYYYKPRIDMEVLREYHEGVIALSACLAGEVATNLKKNNYEQAKEAALRHLEIFGEGNYYLEMQDHGIPEQKLVNAGVMRLSKETGIPMVVTNDSHYINASDAEAHDILLCIQTGKIVTDKDRMRYEGGQYYLKSPQEMAELFPYAPEAIENTCKIADMCDVEIVFGEQKLPRYDVPDGYDAYTYLRELCQKGLNKRYSVITEKLQSRLDYELDTIRNMGFLDYFLIVWDFIHYARENHIAVGPGRGSSAGSIVAYCLEITNIDPIKYSLLFERFLNPERVTMPDIDIDFCPERRQEVIDYVIRKYGKDNVVQINTFGTMAAKMAIRDVGRALDLPYNLCDRVAKAVPSELKMTLPKALEQSKEFKEMYDGDPQIKKLVDMAIQLEGLPRHVTTHPAGVVIGRKPIIEYVPLARGTEGAITTQYSQVTIEELGLLKMDFLGLRTLTVIQDAVRHVKENRGIDIDIDNIGFEDEEVYEMLSAGKTEGVFQLESAGMTSFMKQLKPRNIEDVIAGISLYRPGPMDFIPLYIKGKEHPDEVKYDTPKLEHILKQTYGCIVYQEQVMQIVMELAGYTMGQSDNVRRAMSKKKEDVILRERKSFVYGDDEKNIPGCIKNGISEDVANKIYDEMTDFAKYAFNKSHATVYAVVAYQTAYLKCHYPVEFMAALISSVKDNAGKMAAYIQCCRDMGIEILPPDINEGVGDFSVSNNSIRYGLSGVKSVGEGVTDVIRDEIKVNGPFKSLVDFVSRLSNKEANKRTIESFICAGAFDSFGYTRKQLLMTYPEILEQSNRDKKNAMSGQMSLMDFLGEEEKTEFEVKYPDVGEFSREELLTMEKDVLGVYISGHPLDDYMDIIDSRVNIASYDFKPDDETGSYGARDNERYTIGGMVETVTVKMTKRGDTMAFVTLEDLYGTVELVVFAREYGRYKNILVKDAKLLVSGTASVSERDAKLRVSDIRTFEDIRQNKDAEKRELWIRFYDMEEYGRQERRLLDILSRHGGRTCVFVMIMPRSGEGDKPVMRTMKPLGDGFRVFLDNALISELKTAYGEDNVAVREIK